MCNIDIIQVACNDTRNLVIELSYRAKSAHLGSSLSCVEIVTYFLNAKKNKLIDKFIMSKGHAAMALYSAANVLGYLEDHHLINYLKDNTALWGHPSYNDKFSSFIDWSTGSLGHGLPVSTGFAFGRKLDKQSGKIVCLVSDGELDEGTNWEAILFAGHHKLHNLIMAVDYNKIQSYGTIDDVVKLEPLADKFRAFNWHVTEIDGHNLNEIDSVFKRQNSEKPLVLICHTVKGKGVPHIENTIASHYKPACEFDIIKRKFQ